MLCTIANTRTSAHLVLQKAWVNGAIGDTADLAINGATSPPGFATATVPDSGNGVSADNATTTVLSGEKVNLAETLAASNTATYTSQITCDQPGLTPDGNGEGGTLAVPADPVAVTCTITNARPAPVPTVTKSVTSSTQEANGSWTTVYTLAVINAATDPPVQYTLSDTLSFGPNITINTTAVTGPPDEAVNPSWNGRTDTTVVARGALGTGQTDHYTVTVNATVADDATADDASCSAGGGFLNKAQVSLAPSGPAVTSAQADLTTSQSASACASGVLSETTVHADPLPPPLAPTGAAVAGILATALAVLVLGLLLRSVNRRRARTNLI